MTVSNLSECVLMAHNLYNFDENKCNLFILKVATKWVSATVFICYFWPDELHIGNECFHFSPYLTDQQNSLCSSSSLNLILNGIIVVREVHYYICYCNV